jgi:hypothetical protein
VRGKKAVRVIIKMIVEGKRGKGISKRRWLDTIKNNMRAIGIYEGDVENRGERRFRTRMANPKWFGEKRRGKRRRKYFFILFISDNFKYSTPIPSKIIRILH